MTITVTALATCAVKATRIRSVDAVQLDEHGARGDRAFYVIDASGALVNGKRLGVLQQVIADYDLAAGVLALRFPDGSRSAAQVRLGPAVDTTFFSRADRLRLLDGPWSEALSAFAGERLRLVAAEIGVDRGREGAVSLMSRASLTELARVGEAVKGGDGETPVDGRRFRMLIEVDGIGPHEEDGWVGRALTVGPALVRVHGNIGRCVTTTRSPESGDVTLPTLRMLARYRLHDLETTERLPFGIHGEVLRGGTVRVGDPVTLMEE
jgi:uncharacterized protein YcbX